MAGRHARNLQRGWALWSGHKTIRARGVSDLTKHTRKCRSRGRFFNFIWVPPLVLRKRFVLSEFRSPDDSGRRSSVGTLSNVSAIGSVTRLREICLPEPYRVSGWDDALTLFPGM